jgi:hypothetical protein
MVMQYSIQSERNKGMNGVTLVIDGSEHTGIKYRTGTVVTHIIVLHFYEENDNTGRIKLGEKRV